MALLPPIIENKVSAFIRTSKCEVIIYFQDNSNECSKSQIILRVTDNLGYSLLKNEYLLADIEEFDLGLVSTSDQQRTRYRAIIQSYHLADNSGAFPLNRQLHIEAFSIAQVDPATGEEIKLDPATDIDLWMRNEANNSLHSVASQGVIKYAIAQPTFNLSYIQDGTEKPFDSSIPYQPELFFKGYLTFDNNAESDSLAYYYVQTNDNIPTSPTYPEIDTFGKRYAAFSMGLSQDKPSNKIIITYYTVKGYVNQLVYAFNTTDVVYSEDVIINGTTATVDSSNACVKLSVTLESSIDSIGVIKVYRTEAKEELLLEVNAKTDKNAPNKQQTYDIYDTTVEAGKIYSYRVDYYFDNNKQLAKPDMAKAENIFVIFDGIYLTTKEMSIKISYDAEISAYKHNVVDVVSATLGGKYPYIRRNGQQNYRSFNLNGMITIESLRDDSYNAEDIRDSFASTASTGLSHDFITERLYAPSSINFAVRSEEFDDTLSRYYNLYINGTITQSEYQVICEKLYRDKIVEFLYSPQIKLFKSLEEGNMFVYLTNIQLTPNKTLSRRVYNFSCQVVEAIPTTMENYNKYFSFKEDQESYVWKDLYLSSHGFDTDGALKVRAYDEGGTYSQEFALAKTGENKYTLILVKKETQVITDESTGG